MSNSLTVDLDNISQDDARRIAGFILAYAGYEGEDAPDLTDPALVFGSPKDKAVKPPAPLVANFPDGTTTETMAEILRQPVAISQAAPSVTIPQATPVAAAPTGPQVDIKGLPWDARIHSANRSLNADGTWRIKRGVDKAELSAVEAQLRQVMAIPSPAAGPQLIQSIPVPALQQAPVSLPAPPPPPPLPPATVTAPPTAADTQAYIALFNKTSSAMAEGRITAAQIQKLADGVGLPSFMMLATRLDLVPQLNALIDGILSGNAQG